MPVLSCCAVFIGCVKASWVQTAEVYDVLLSVVPCGPCSVCDIEHGTGKEWSANISSGSPRFETFLN